MRLTVVGCSGSYPGPQSPASCYLVSAEGVDPTSGQSRTWNVLLDLGSGALGALQRHVDPGTLDAIVLSHLHPDHCLDLCGLYVYLKYHPTQRFPRLPVYGPTGSAERLARAYDLDPHPGMREQFDFRELADGAEFAVGPFTVTPGTVLHPVEAYGLRVEGPSENGSGSAVLTYSGDTDDCDGLRTLASGAGLLLAEAAFITGRDDARGVHLTGARAGAVATASGAKHLVLTHSPPWNPAGAAATEAASEYHGQITTAAPDLVLSV